MPKIYGMQQTSNSFSGQRAKILALLTAAKGGEVPLPQIRVLSAQYNARIYELRRAGFRIPPPRMETVKGGARYTWYRLESTPAPVRRAEPAAESLFHDAPERHRDDN